MVTADQISELLASYGVDIPQVMLDAIVAQLNTVSACVDANYPPATATLIYLYAGAIMAGNAGTRQIKSQGAPSGASRSFDNPTNGFTQLRRTLSGLDTFGCTSGIIGADPKTGNFFAVVGGD